MWHDLLRSENVFEFGSYTSTCSILKKCLYLRRTRMHLPLLIIQVVFLLSFFFQTFEYFRETTQLLEQHGSISVRNGKVAILQDKDVHFSANMWRPILTAYWVSNTSDFLVCMELPDQIHVTILCYFISHNLLDGLIIYIISDHISVLRQLSWWWPRKTVDRDCKANSGQCSRTCSYWYVRLINSHGAILEKTLRTIFEIIPFGVGNVFHELWRCNN